MLVLESTLRSVIRRYDVGHNLSHCRATMSDSACRYRIHLWCVDIGFNSDVCRYCIQPFEVVDSHRDKTFSIVDVPVDVGLRRGQAINFHWNWIACCPTTNAASGPHLYLPNSRVNRAQYENLTFNLWRIFIMITWYVHFLGSIDF